MVGAFFPMNFVEEIELDSLVKDDADDDHLLGTLEKSFFNVHNLRPEPRGVNSQQRHVFRVTDDSTGQSVDCAVENEFEMNLWIEKIREAAKALSERSVLFCFCLCTLVS